MFLISAKGINDYYLLAFLNGKVQFTIATATGAGSVIMDNNYYDGNFYQLQALHTPSNMQLTLEPLDKSRPAEIKAVTANLNPQALSSAGYYFGGQDDSFIVGPISTSFSGSIQDFKHSSTSTPDLVTETFNQNPLNAFAVDLNKSIAKVRPGLGFLSLISFAKVFVPLSSRIQTITISFNTNALSGILLFAQLNSNNIQQPSGAFLYLALYNGDAYLIFNQGQGVQPTIKTTSLFLSDGQDHRISLDFGFQNSPRLKIDNLETHVGAVTMLPYMNLLDGSIYLGGIPPSIGIDRLSTPIRSSIIGAMLSLSVNAVVFDFCNPNTFNKATSTDISLSGVPIPTMPPKPICDPCPVTTPLPACYLNTVDSSTYNGNVYKFGNALESYIAFSTDGKQAIYLNKFSISLRFNALQPDGLMLYMASATTSSPDTYFAVFMYKGLLRISFKSNNTLTQLSSKKNLVDGKWHSCDILRLNNFVALVIADVGDVSNNQLSQDIPSSLIINTGIYLGGYPYSLPNLPPEISVGKSPFQGCIGNVSTTSVSNVKNFLTYALIVMQNNINPCPVALGVGVSLTTSASYVRLADASNQNMLFDLSSGFSISIVFQTSFSYGILAVAWVSASKFVTISIEQGEIQVILSSTSQPLILKSQAFLNQYSICNNAFHTVNLVINLNNIQLKIDSSYQISKSFDNFLYAAPLATPFYIGGIKDSSWSIPGIFTGQSFNGCIRSVVVNNVNVVIAQSTDSQGSTSWC